MFCLSSEVYFTCKTLQSTPLVINNNPDRLIIGLVDQFLWGKEDFRGRSFRLTSYPHCFTSWRQGNVLFSVSLIYVGRLCGLQTFLTESHSCTFDSGSSSVIMHIQLPYVIMQPCGILMEPMFCTVELIWYWIIVYTLKSMKCQIVIWHTQNMHLFSFHPSMDLMV